MKPTLIKKENSKEVEKNNKEMYDKFGKEYQKSRDEKQKSRLYNEYLEVPSMIQAVGNVKGKKLLDIGCGAGVHIEYYLKKGAKCYGLDLSKTLIELAKQKCPKAEFKVSSMTKLPYKDNSFDIITSSLAIDYVDNIETVFKEVRRVLKKGGLFYYSTENPLNHAKDRYEDNEIKIVGYGEFKDKKTGKYIVLGKPYEEGLTEWEMLPGMKLKSYKKTFRSHLKALRKAGLELIDLFDCKPTEEFKKLDTEEYTFVSKLPVFSIYVAQKRLK